MTGACDLYDSRPISCRTNGLPVRFGSENLPSCRLCFLGAPDSEVERCRVTPDPHRVEDAILTRPAKDGGGEHETLIAWAVAGPEPGD